MQTIQLNNLSIGYKEKGKCKLIAKHINATLNSNELTCLLGANGAGKSTLLRTLSSFLPKIEGEIHILNKEIEAYTDKELSRLVSVVLTERCDLRNITVKELVGLGRNPYTNFWGNLDKSDRQVVEKSLCLVRMESFADRMVETLSDGERQKVMIAKALAQETPIIILDEPTAFLDFPSKVEMMQLLNRLSRETNKTIFLSTHDLELALQIADKLWLMERKHNSLSIGTPEDLALNGELSRFFSGKGISFDAETGLFRVLNECHSFVCLKGKKQNSIAWAMIQKALARNYIGTIYDEVNDSQIPVIEIGNQNFVITYNDEVVYTNTIEETLLQIKAML